MQTSRVLSHIIKVPFEVNYKLREFSVTKENSISPCVTIRNRKDIYDFSWIEDKKEICFKRKIELKTYIKLILTEE